MVDSVQVLPPGWTMPENSSTRLPYDDGIIYFFDAGTSDAKAVYADAALSTSLGTSVSCNSSGFPVSSGNAKILIYVDAQPYKIRITSATFGGTILEADNVRGALDTSMFLTSAAVADRNIVNVSNDRAVTIDDKGSLLNVNCSAGVITLTFDDASDMEGFWGGFRHDGTANQVKITGDGTDTFGLPGVNATAFSLTGRGQTVWISCDGVSFKIENEAPPLMMGNMGTILVADLLSTPPVSPTPGARYIVGAAPTGAWSSFVTNDIAEANGFGGWFRYTPAANAGWRAYVQDENQDYQFRTAGWIPATASDTVAGLLEIAVQSEMEAGSSEVLAVTPGRQLFHPAHPKVGGCLVGTGTPAFMAGDYGFGAVTDVATGVYTVALDTAFSNTNYWFNGTAKYDGSGAAELVSERETARSASSFSLLVHNSETSIDSSAISISGWGDYA